MREAAREVNGEAMCTGGAGTGKTLTTVMLLKHLRNDGIKFIVCAPTHKACEVFRQMSGEHNVPCEVVTIHKFLSLKPKRSKTGEFVLVQGHRSKDLFEDPPDVVLIDEVSMNDSQVDAFIIKEMEESSISFLYIGDKAQIPPVNELESPTFERVNNVTNLSKVWRQAKNNPIISLATEVRMHIENKGDFPDLRVRNLKGKKSGKAGVWHFTDPGSVWPSINAAVEQSRDCCYIAYTNAKVNQAGRRMRQLMMQDREDFEPGERYTVNAQVEKVEHIVVPEDKRLLLAEQFHNNELVTIKSRTPMMMPPRTDYYKDAQIEVMDRLLPLSPIEGYWIETECARAAWQPKNIAHIRNIKDRIFKIPIEERRSLFPELSRIESFIDLRVPYSLTVHKSQGSAFDIVVLDLEDLNKALNAYNPEDLLRKRKEYLNLLYTGMTRARQILLLIGETEYS